MEVFFYHIRHFSFFHFHLQTTPLGLRSGEWLLNDLRALPSLAVKEPIAFDP